MLRKTLSSSWHVTPTLLLIALTTASLTQDTSAACLPGTLLLDDTQGGGCIACYAGHFCNETDAYKPWRCPANTYNTKTGATNISACIPCPTGLISRAGARFLSDCQPTSLQISLTTPDSLSHVWKTTANAEVDGTGYSAQFTVPWGTTYFKEPKISLVSSNGNGLTTMRYIDNSNNYMGTFPRDTASAFTITDHREITAFPSSNFTVVLLGSMNTNYIYAARAVPDGSGSYKMLYFLRLGDGVAPSGIGGVHDGCNGNARVGASSYMHADDNDPGTAYITDPGKSGYGIFRRIRYNDTHICATEMHAFALGSDKYIDKSWMINGYFVQQLRVLTGNQLERMHIIDVYAPNPNWADVDDVTKGYEIPATTMMFAHICKYNLRYCIMTYQSIFVWDTLTNTFSEETNCGSTKCHGRVWKMSFSRLDSLQLIVTDFSTSTLSWINRHPLTYADCAVGFFKYTDPGADGFGYTDGYTCLPCPGNTSSPAASTDASACSCAASGYWRSADDMCFGCTVCTASMFRTSNCTTTTDTQCSPCTVCLGTEYQTVACTATTNRECAACTTCSAGQFASTECAGTTDAVCSACTTCLGTEYQVSDCAATADRVCSACTTCLGTEYQVSDCTATTDRVCTACTTCSASEYKLVSCTATTDTVCEPIITPTPVSDMTGATCSSGYSLSNGSLIASLVYLPFDDTATTATSGLYRDMTEAAGEPARLGETFGDTGSLTMRLGYDFFWTYTVFPPAGSLNGMLWNAGGNTDGAYLGNVGTSSTMMMIRGGDGSTTYLSGNQYMVMCTFNYSVFNDNKAHVLEWFFSTPTDTVYTWVDGTPACSNTAAVRMGASDQRYAGSNTASYGQCVDSLPTGESNYAWQGGLDFLRYYNDLDAAAIDPAGRALNITMAHSFNGTGAAPLTQGMRYGPFDVVKGAFGADFVLWFDSTAATTVLIAFDYIENPGTGVPQDLQSWTVEAELVPSTGVVTFSAGTRGSSPTLTSTTTTLAPMAWTRMTVHFTPESVRYYANQTLVASITLASTFLPLSVFLRAGTYSTGSPALIVMDDLRVFASQPPASLWEDICQLEDMCLASLDNCDLTTQTCAPVGSTAFTCTCNSGYVQTSATTCAPCTVCAAPPTEYETSACSILADTVCNPCTTCLPPPLEYTSQQCTASADTVCVACTQCTPGTYASADCASSTDTVCDICLANFWCSSNRNYTCPLFSSSPPGSNVQQNCTCNAGFHGLPGDLCHECIADHYCPGGGGDTIIPCPANSSALYQSSTINDCICDKGFYWDANNTGCVICPIGSWCDSGVRMKCPMPFHMMYAPTGSSLATDCICRAGFVGNHTFCRDCPADHYCGGGSAINQCVGNSSSLVRSNSTAACICDRGFYGGAESGPCIPCPENHWCWTGILNPCTEHGISERMVSWPTNCSCDRGFTGPDGGPCLPCTVDTYKDRINSSPCSPCPNTTTGTLSAIASTSVLDCACPWRYGRIPNSEECRACQRDEYLDTSQLPRSTAGCEPCSFKFNDSFWGRYLVGDVSSAANNTCLLHCSPMAYAVHDVAAPGTVAECVPITTMRVEDTPSFQLHNDSACTATIATTTDIIPNVTQWALCGRFRASRRHLAIPFVWNVFADPHGFTREAFFNPCVKNHSDLCCLQQLAHTAHLAPQSQLPAAEYTTQESCRLWALTSLAARQIRKLRNDTSARPVEAVNDSLALQVINIWDPAGSPSGTTIVTMNLNVSAGPASTAELLSKPQAGFHCHPRLTTDDTLLCEASVGMLFLAADSSRARRHHKPDLQPESHVNVVQTHQLAVSVQQESILILATAQRHSCVTEAHSEFFVDGHNDNDVRARVTLHLKTRERITAGDVNTSRLEIRVAAGDTWGEPVTLVPLAPGEQASASIKVASNTSAQLSLEVTVSQLQLYTRFFSNPSVSQLGPWDSQVPLTRPAFHLAVSLDLDSASTSPLYRTRSKACTDTVHARFGLRTFIDTQMQARTYQNTGRVYVSSGLGPLAEFQEATALDNTTLHSALHSPVIGTGRLAMVTILVQQQQQSMNLTTFDTLMLAFVRAGPDQKAHAERLSRAFQVKGSEGMVKTCSRSIGVSNCAISSLVLRSRVMLANRVLTVQNTTTACSADSGNQYRNAVLRAIRTLLHPEGTAEHVRDSAWAVQTASEHLAHICQTPESSNAQMTFVATPQRKWQSPAGPTQNDQILIAMNLKIS